MVVNVTVYPTSAYILRPGILHPGPPSSDTNVILVFLVYVLFV